jgi:hypothetical protein
MKLHRATVLIEDGSARDDADIVSSGSPNNPASVYVP